MIREGLTWEPIEKEKARQRMAVESRGANICTPEDGKSRDIIAHRVK